MTETQIQQSCELLRKKLYHEQPDTMGTIEGLIDLLACIHCEHKWVTEPRGDDREPVCVCDKCGMHY